METEVQQESFGWRERLFGVAGGLVITGIGYFAHIGPLMFIGALLTVLMIGIW